jgi:tetratricopeptide (TPR) repeat protein
LWRLARVLAVALTCAVPAAAQDAPAPPAQAPPERTAALEQLNRIGRDLLASPAQRESAVAELKKMLAADPGFAEAHLWLGVAYRLEGSPEMAAEALAELRQAIDLNPALLPARVYLAQAYSDLGRPERARDELTKALEQAPNTPQLLAMLGDVERRLKNPARAMELIEQALKADPSLAQARYYHALALLDLRRRDEAIKELEAVIQSGARVADVYLTLGDAYLDARRYPDAAEILSQGTHVDPTRPDLRIHLARAYRLSGALDKAETQLQAAVPERAPSALVAQQYQLDLLAEQGALRLRQRRLPEAAALLEKALTLDPESGPANRDLAEVYLLQGRFRQSRELALRAQKLGFPLSEARRKQLDAGLQTSGGKL